MLTRAVPPTRALVASIWITQPSSGDCVGPKSMSIVVPGEAQDNVAGSAEPIPSTQRPTLHACTPDQAGLPLTSSDFMIHSMI